MVLHSMLDFSDINKVCNRLFKYRRNHDWPPKVTLGDGWREVYEDASSTIDDASGLFPSVEEAVVWVNNLIMKIDIAV